MYVYVLYNIIRRFKYILHVYELKYVLIIGI